MAYDTEKQLLAGFKAALAAVSFSPSVTVRRWRLAQSVEDYPCVYVHVGTATQELDGSPLSGQLSAQVTVGVQTDVSYDSDGADCDTLFGQLRQALASNGFVQALTTAMTGVTITGMQVTGATDEAGDQDADVYGRSFTFTVSVQ